MPMIQIDGVAFTPEEARDAILLRNAIGGHPDSDTSFPDFREMSEQELRHWLGTAVINAKKQIEQHTAK